MGSTAAICGASELCINNRISLFSWTRYVWIRSQTLVDLGAGAWNLRFGSTALVQAPSDVIYAPAAASLFPVFLSKKLAPGLECRAHVSQTTPHRCLFRQPITLRLPELCNNMSNDCILFESDLMTSVSRLARQLFYSGNSVVFPCSSENRSFFYKTRKLSRQFHENACVFAQVRP